MVEYSEKTSFIWYQIDQRKLVPNQHYDLVIMGDSQIMSGVNPHYLKNLLKKKGKKYKILYYPRPSEQPEGILNNLYQLEKKNITYDNFFANISPVTVSQNNIVSAHRNLALNINSFQADFYFKSLLNSFYIKTVGEHFYYLILQIFPLFKLNSNFSSEWRLIPSNEKTNLLAKDINSFLKQNPFQNFAEKKRQNLFLKRELVQNDFYWEWGSFEHYTGECKKKEVQFNLPDAIAGVFLVPRLKAERSWNKVLEYLSKKGCSFFLIYIQFSPETESKIQSNATFSPIHQTIQKLKKQYQENVVLELPNSFLDRYDYVDYTHLSVCGMKKLTEFLSDKL